MNIISVCGAAILTLALSVMLKNNSHAPASYLPTVTGILIITCVITALSPIIEFLTELSEPIHNGNEILSILLKTTGTSLLTHTVADICRDHNERNMAEAVEFAGNAAALLLALPILRYILSDITVLLK